MARGGEACEFFNLFIDFLTFLWYNDVMQKEGFYEND